MLRRDELSPREFREESVALERDDAAVRWQRFRQAQGRLTDERPDLQDACRAERAAQKLQGPDGQRTCPHTAMQQGLRLLLPELLLPINCLGVPPQSIPALAHRPVHALEVGVEPAAQLQSAAQARLARIGIGFVKICKRLAELGANVVHEREGNGLFQRLLALRGALVRQVECLGVQVLGARMPVALGGHGATTIAIARRRGGGENCGQGVILVLGVLPCGVLRVAAGGGGLLRGAQERVADVPGRARRVGSQRA
mmetsp:Transcript_37907/g.114500  ORF Transcript_37907/g.114500 Transcript_37907/m.114500 type:complete len:256 (+) Transcript_37907:956-1723(+)